MTTLMKKKREVLAPGEAGLNPAHKVHLPKWEIYSNEVLDGKGIVVMDGGRPDKVIEALTVEESVTLSKLFRSGGVTDYVIVSADGWSRGHSLMGVAMVMADLGWRNKGAEPRVWLAGDSMPALTKVNGNIIKVCIEKMKERII